MKPLLLKFTITNTTTTTPILRLVNPFPLLMGSNALWCNNCALSLTPHLTHDETLLCCSFCGKVVGDCNWSEQLTFSSYADQQYKRKSGIPGTNRDEKVHMRELNETGGKTKHEAVDDSDFDDSHGSNKLSGESDTFSDINDHEIDSYIHNKKEQQYKKIIWEELNREYIEKQLAKKAAAEEAYNAYMRNCSEGMDVVGKLTAANAAATETKSRKGSQQKRAKEVRNPVPSRIVAEATRQMLAKKTLESKINYAILDELFNESLSPQDAKRSRFGGAKANS